MNPERIGQAQAAALAWSPGSQVVRAWELGGGMSAEMVAVELLTDGLAQTVVARFPSPYMRTLFEDAAAHEYRTLESVVRAGLPAPRPLAIAAAPDGNFLLLAYLDGQATAFTTDTDAYVDQMAAALAAVHGVDLATHSFDFLLATRRGFHPPDREPDPDLREAEVIQALKDLVPENPGPEVLRHGDFWPGNLLWTDGRLTGIVDWENALRGPALADLAISRLDVWWVFGREAMETFTTRYLARCPIGTENLAYWDLRAALRPMESLSEWAAPYASLHRSDISHEHMRAVLLEFVEMRLAGNGKRGTGAME